MAELTIYYRGNPILKEALTGALTIGSGEDNDICLLDSVAPHHARIEVTKDKIVLIGGEGKVIANGEPILGSRSLKDGDLFDIGAYRFQMLESSVALSRIKRLDKTATASLQGSIHAPGTVIPAIHFLSPIKKSFRRTQLLIGRSPGCDLVVKNQFVSSQHAELFVKEGHYMIRDLHSRNGTYVNDFKVTERPLPPSGIIRFGQYSFPYQIESGSSADPEEQEGIAVPGLRPDDPERRIVGRSESLQSLIATLKKVAPTNDSVLLLGETGTGKDLLAHFLHFGNPKRRPHPFVVVNCAAIPPSLAESQLFGHVRGAFTGALGDYAGFFQQAHRGTLFLDEIGELPIESQARLLRVIEGGLVRPLGSPKEIAVDVRLVLATNRNLDQERPQERFREDLYQRFDWVLKVPPLRERPEDVPLLVRYFISRHSLSPLSVDSHLMPLLQSLPWKGNIRELNRSVRRAITNAVARGSSVLQKEDFAMDRSDSDSGNTEGGKIPELSASRVRSLKRASLAETLKAHQGNVTLAAKALGISRITIYEWLKSEGIDLASFRRSV